MGGGHPGATGRNRNFSALSSDNHSSEAARSAGPLGHARSFARSKWAAVLAWFVVLLEIAAWMAMRRGDEMVIPTLLAYGARWVWLLPVAALAPLGFWRRSTLIPLALAAGLCVVGVMQFQPPHVSTKETCCRLTVVTINGDQQARPDAFRRLIEDEHADVVAMQEWDEEAMGNALSPWHVHCEGELCLGSRHPIGKVDILGRGTVGGSRAMILETEVTTENGPVSFFSIHLDTVRKGIEPMLHEGVGGTDELRDNLAFRDRQSAQAASWIRAHAAHPFVIAGDFNMPTDSAIYRRHWREWADAFESAGTGFGHTKFTSLWGIRIDHVLFDPQWQAVSSRVGPDVGSDHRPLIVTLQRAPSAPSPN